MPSAQKELKLGAERHIAPWFKASSERQEEDGRTDGRKEREEQGRGKKRGAEEMKQGQEREERGDACLI